MRTSQPSTMVFCKLELLMRAALLCLVLLVGCKETNPHYCPEYDNNLCPPGGDGMQMDCDNSTDCTMAGALVCRLSDHKCVQCTAMETSACMGSTPICANDACRGCTSHDECPLSNACLPDGSCADMNNVAYVGPGGTGPCTKASPCGSLLAAQGLNKPVIKFLTGTTTGDAGPVVITGKSVTIIADAGAELRRSGGTAGTQLVVSGANTNVGIYDLKIGGGTTTTGNGIDLIANGGTPKLTLGRVTIDTGDGVGVIAMGGELTMTQSIIRKNKRGALRIDGSVFKVINNIMHDNGENSAPAPMVSIVGSVATDVFEYNTVTQNNVMDGIVTALSCAGFVVVRNNIFWLNNDANPTSMTHVAGNCTLQTTIVGPIAPVGPPLTGTVDMDPKFGNPASFDFELSATSPARNFADTPLPMTGLFAIDYEGESRPRPTDQKADIGADEAP